MTAFSFIDKAQRLLTVAKGQEFYNGWASILCIVIFLFLFAVAVRKRDHSKRQYMFFPLILVFVFGNQYRSAHNNLNYLSTQYTELMEVYNSRQYQVVEGAVHILHMQPEGGHDSGDIIQIDGVELEFSCFSNTLGYNKTIVFGGVLTEGTVARLFYYQPEGWPVLDSIILQIDLLEPVTNPIPKIDPRLPCVG